MRCRRQFSSDFDGGNISGVLIVDGGSEHIDGRVVDIIGMRATKGINVKLIPVLGLILARALPPDLLVALRRRQSNSR